MVVMRIWLWYWIVKGASCLKFTLMAEFQIACNLKPLLSKTPYLFFWELFKNLSWQHYISSTWSRVTRCYILLFIDPLSILTFWFAHSFDLMPKVQMSSSASFQCCDLACQVIAHQLINVADNYQAAMTHPWFYQLDIHLFIHAVKPKLRKLMTHTPATRAIWPACYHAHVVRGSQITLRESCFVQIPEVRYWVFFWWYLQAYFY